jgi:hypothetical protein
MNANRRIPPVPNLDRYTLALAHVMAETSFLPARETVMALNGPAFPAIRARRNRPRFSHFEQNGIAAGMYDDNVTPAWALFWAHDLEGTRPKGWNIAHVWSATDDIASFTHLANLALIPECLASLTDKVGPLTRFLQWHAWSVYGWKPPGYDEPTKPNGYGQIKWRYLEATDNPRACICARILKHENQRLVKLKPIMQRLGLL